MKKIGSGDGQVIGPVVDLGKDKDSKEKKSEPKKVK
jgi:hypothetical protein